MRKLFVLIVLVTLTTSWNAHANLHNGIHINGMLECRTLILGGSGHCNIGFELGGHPCKNCEVAVHFLAGRTFSLLSDKDLSGDHDKHHGHSHKANSWVAEATLELNYDIWVIKGYIFSMAVLFRAENAFAFEFTNPITVSNTTFALIGLKFQVWRFRFEVYGGAAMTVPIQQSPSISFSPAIGVNIVFGEWHRFNKNGRHDHS